MQCVADETVSGVIAKWSAAFNRLDADALARLYSGNAFFFGSKSQLYRGNEGVAAYFSAAAMELAHRSIHRPRDGTGQFRSDQFCRDRVVRRR
jgi:ketosteroid isomerase-like protein